MSVITPVAPSAAGTSVQQQAQAAPTAAAGTLPAEHFMPPKQKSAQTARKTEALSPLPVLVPNKRKTPQVASMRRTIKNAPNSKLAEIRIAIARRHACQQQRELVRYLKLGGAFPDIGRLTKWIDLDGQEISETSERSLLWQATRAPVEYRGQQDEPDAAVGHREQSRAELYHQQQRRFDKLHYKRQKIKKDKNLSRQPTSYHQARKAKQLVARAQRRLDDASVVAPPPAAKADTWDDEEEEKAKNKEEKEVSRLQQEFQRKVEKTNEQAEEARKRAKQGVQTYNRKATASLFQVEGEEEGEHQQSSIPEDIEFLALGDAMDEEGEEWFKRALPHGSTLLAAAEAFQYGLDSFDNRLMAHTFLAKLPMQQAVRVHRQWNKRAADNNKLRATTAQKASGVVGFFMMLIYLFIMLVSLVALWPLIKQAVHPLWQALLSIKRRVSDYFYGLVGQVVFYVYYKTLEQVKWLPRFLQDPIHGAARNYVQPLLEGSFWDESERPQKTKPAKPQQQAALVKVYGEDGGAWWSISTSPKKKETTSWYRTKPQPKPAKPAKSTTERLRGVGEWLGGAAKSGLNKIRAVCQPAQKAWSRYYDKFKEGLKKVVRRVYVRLFWKHKGEVIEPSTEIDKTSGYVTTTSAHMPTSVCLTDQQCLDVLSSIMTPSIPLLLNAKSAATAAAGGSRTSSENRRPANKITEQLRALEAENRGLKDALAEKTKEQKEKEEAEEEAKLTPAQKSLKQSAVFRTPIVDAVKNADLHNKTYKFEEIPDEIKLLPEYKQIEQLSNSKRLIFAARKNLTLSDKFSLVLYPMVLGLFHAAAYIIEATKKLGDSIQQVITRFWSFFKLPLVGEFFSFVVLVPLKLGIKQDHVWELHDYFVVATGLMKEVNYNAVINVKTVYADMRSASVASACKQYLPTIEALVRDESDEEFLPFFFSVADWLPMDLSDHFKPTKTPPKSINLTFGGSLIRRLTGRTTEEVSSQISSLYNRDSIHSFSKVVHEHDRTVEYAISRSIQENHLEGRLFSSTLLQ